MRFLRVSPHRRPTWLAAVLTVIVGATLAVVAPTPAHAAVWYWYNPSQMVTHVPGTLWCTGGWGIRHNGDNAPSFLTAGHCFSPTQQSPVAIYTNYSSQYAIGSVALADDFFPGSRDTALIRPSAGVDGLQQIPGVGKAVGLVGNGYLTTAGGGIAMWGATSRLQYGELIGGWVDVPVPGGFPERVVCGDYLAQGGDSGAPVFIHFGNQVYVAGVHIGRFDPGGPSCFKTIEDLLVWHNAWLPVFPPGTQSAQEATVMIDSARQLYQPHTVIDGTFVRD